MTNILWLRRDLQLADNASLTRALHEDDDIQPIFIFDTDILARFTNKQDRRISFLINTVLTLDAELKKKGGGLLVLKGSAKKIIPELAKEFAGMVFAGEDYEPSTVARDVEVGKQTDLVLSKQHVIMSPNEVLRDNGQMFKVFTPYSKAWKAKLKDSDFAIYKTDDKNRYAKYDNSLKTAISAGYDIVPLKSAKDAAKHIGYEYVEDKLWHPAKAHDVLKQFMSRKISNYHDARDYPAIDGTSTLSPYLRFGLVTIRQAYNEALKHKDNGTWINELIWREFYAAVLFHWPETVNKEFQPEYRALKWNYDKDALQKWKDGKTGFPIVDAGMRQLLEDGWMHNRVRMIVASFLTKDLLIDWRAGEEHFAQYLMDYEQASNVGGWQWAASTGTDAAPYFRIFNPYLQSAKFDPKAEYIKKYIPELRNYTGKNIHEPGNDRPENYPAPMVNHKEMRDKILRFFKSVK